MNRHNIEDISQQISEKGFVKIENIFDFEKYKFFNHKKKGGYLSYPINFKQKIIKLLKLDIQKIFYSINLIKISNDLKFSEISDKYFMQKSQLRMIDSYYSERSNEFIINWHNDLALPSRLMRENNNNQMKYISNTLTNKNGPSRGLKFFIYLSDVQINNGSLAIIPYSHHIVRAYSSLVLEKKIPLNCFWSLKEFRNILENDETKKLIAEKLGHEKLELFLTQSEFIDWKQQDTNDFDIEMKKGGLIIFDELCFHRGSAPQKNSRLVLRYLYKKNQSLLNLI